METIAPGSLTQSSLEAEVAALLTDLLSGQNELMEILSRKRALLAAADHRGLSAIAADEQRLLDMLQECLRRREQLLARAAAEGLPAGSVQALAQALPAARREPLTRQITAAQSRARLLRHHSLINWIVVQRTLIHLSQLLEIIATGGRFQPTYGEAGRSCAHGALVDHTA
ncbi:MAG: flagellar export chaperone FlgN [Thermoguttaceae bacterium]|jgi:hypothetical protein